MDRLDAVLQELRTVSVPPVASPPLRTHRIPKPLRLAFPALALGIALAMVVYHRAPAEQPIPTANSVGKWQRILERIDADRMDAFIRGDETMLKRADVGESPAIASDLGIVNDLRARSLRLDHNPIHIDAVSEEYLAITADPNRVGLLVTDHLDAHAYLDEDNVVVESRPARGRRLWMIELQRFAGSKEWRLFSAEPAPQQSAPSTRPGN